MTIAGDTIELLEQKQNQLVTFNTETKEVDVWIRKTVESIPSRYLPAIAAAMAKKEKTK